VREGKTGTIVGWYKKLRRLTEMAEGRNRRGKEGGIINQLGLNWVGSGFVMRAPRKPFGLK
jgi:hypothetical protein